MTGGRSPQGVSICIPHRNHRNYRGRSIGSARRAAGLLSNDFVDERISDMNYIDAFSRVDADQIERWAAIAARMPPRMRIGNCCCISAPRTSCWSSCDGSGLLPCRAAFDDPDRQFDHSKMRRVYAQRNTGLPLGFDGRRIYHPDIGWL